MAFSFKDGFNKFAEQDNKFRKGLNNAIGKDVFREVQKIEDPIDYPPLSSFPVDKSNDPVLNEPIVGEEKLFCISGADIRFSAELDACFQYRKVFKEFAEFYTQRFKDRYQLLAKDYDSFVHYFPDIYAEGHIPIIAAACSILLTFGIFNINDKSFYDLHISKFASAANSYVTVAGVEQERNLRAQASGEALGNAVQLRGGGFGLKGAMKGVAKAEAFNMGMGLFGKLAENTMRMTREEKAQVFSKFNTELFFKEVFSDYYHVYLTMVRVLEENHILENVKIEKDEEYQSIINNLNNPMFPKDKMATALSQLIVNYPFEKDGYELLNNKYGDEDDAQELIRYFNCV